MNLWNCKVEWGRIDREEYFLERFQRMEKMCAIAQLAKISSFYWCNQKTYK